MPPRVPFVRVPQGIWVLAFARFLLALGEEMWMRYMPRYLEALGAGLLVVGAWGSLRSGVQAGWQWPGGYLADRWGRRRAVLVLTTVGMGGLLLFLTPWWPAVLVGLLLYGAVSGYGGSVTQSVVAEALPKKKRAVGFAYLSILKKPSEVLGPPAAGFLITVAFGILGGVRAALGVSIVLFLAALVLQHLRFPDLHERQEKPSGKPNALSWSVMPPRMRALLVADTLARFGNSISTTFVVLYVVQVLGLRDLDFGLLVGMQALLSLLLYYPAGYASDRTPRVPWIVFAFAMIAAHPLLLAFAGGSMPLVVASFVAIGLKEVGEPARKALLADLAAREATGRALGAYNGLRQLFVIPAGFLAGVVWLRSPQLVLAGAGLVAAAGVLVVLAFVREPRR